MSYLKQFGQNSTERVLAASRALSAGKGIILIDDEDRENEGDLIFSTTHLSIENVNQMIQDCSGIICLCIKPSLAKQLNLNLMVKDNTSQFKTAFTTSIEAKENVTTGVSAHDRWVTIKTACKKDALPSDLSQPGHVFPLIAREGGILNRRGHTEGSIDLMEIAHLHPSAVLCELMNKDGSMQKLPELTEYALRHDLTMLSIEDIYQYKMQNIVRQSDDELNYIC